MSIEDIQAAVAALSREELAQFRTWYEEFAAARGMTSEFDPHRPLRGTSYTYLDPTEPVAEDDWEVNQP